MKQKGAVGKKKIIHTNGEQRELTLVGEHVLIFTTLMESEDNKNNDSPQLRGNTTDGMFLHGLVFNV